MLETRYYLSDAINDPDLDLVGAVFAAMPGNAETISISGTQEAPGISLQRITADDFSPALAVSGAFQFPIHALEIALDSVQPSDIDAVLSAYSDFQIVAPATLPATWGELIGVAATAIDHKAVFPD